MRISENGIKLIMEFEGCKLKAYKDPVGIWTIGYGHTAGVKEGDTITKEQAENYLYDDLQNAEVHVQAWNHQYLWTQSEFDALVSFTYNCGAGNLGKLLKQGKRTKHEIADAILLYNKAGGKELAGLVRRRKGERELFLRKTTQFYPCCSLTSSRIDVVFDNIGATADYDMKASATWRKRLPIARANAIANYTGTAAQNITLIRLAQEGNLKRP